jgi:hypothetical protein
MTLQMGKNWIFIIEVPYITLTNFERNTIREVPVPESELELHSPFPPDTADFAARKIVDGIESGGTEIFAHDWIKQRTQGNLQERF